MKVIRVDSVTHALREGLHHLYVDGVQEESRNGPVIVAPGPVTTVYQMPWNRVLLGAERNANPFFHVMEFLWMIAGNNDVASVSKFVGRMADYSDDGGKTLWGAYGWRWREFFGYDQLSWIIDELKANPSSRRCVLAMWNAYDTTQSCNSETRLEDLVAGDLYVATHGGKDVPCNTHIYFMKRGDALTTTVCCRSNDAIWGAYGANAVHFSFLHEYVARAVGLRVGELYQISNNLHVYTNQYPREVWSKMSHNCYTPTATRRVAVFDTSKTDEDHMEAASKLLFSKDRETVQYANCPSFITEVALPMLRAWEARDDLAAALAEADGVLDEAWRLAAVQWLGNRAVRGVRK